MTQNSGRLSLEGRKLWVLYLILSASVICSAQMHEVLRASVPQRGSDEYWSVIDEFGDVTIHLAYAKRSVQLHDGSLSDRQCQEYSRIVQDYSARLSMLKQSGISDKSGFWVDMRAYSSQMIGKPGVPIPGHRVSTYWITAGSKAEDDELRRLVALQLDEATTEVGQVDVQRPQDCLAPSRAVPQ